MRRIVTLTCLAFAALAAPAASHPLRAAPKCPILPSSNVWNQRVDTWKIAPNSRTLVRSIGLDAPLHPDFGTRYGIPFTVVGRTQRRVPVRFEYRDESDRGPYPIPRDAFIEPGPPGRNADGDRHVLVVDRDRCKLHELYDAHPLNGGSSWRAGSGAVFDLRSNALRPRGWTSADAAGLPILPGLARIDDVRAGSIDHALRFTARQTRRAFVFPARHFASSSSSPALPPMGTRVRLKRSVSLRGFGPQARIVLLALKRYGMLLADNGSPWFVTGAPSSAWDDDDLHDLRKISGRSFEVVRPPAG